MSPEHDSYQVLQNSVYYTHRRHINEDKIVPNTDNLLYLQFYNFMLVIDTIV